MDPIQLLRHFALALCTWREARGEALYGKLLVCQTIENRVSDPRWPETYIGVITQPWQFSAFNKNDPNALAFPAESDVAWRDSVAAASFVINAPTTLTTANHYHAKSVTPTWARADRIVAREGAHIFYRL